MHRRIVTTKTKSLPCIRASMHPSIQIADQSGFCFGVKRAIELAEKAALKNKNVRTLGPIIHNPQEVKRLNKEGVKTINTSSKVKSGVIVLRTHGIPLEQHKKLKQNKAVKIIDATCPFVKRAQDIVSELGAKNETIVIAGEKAHPEVVGLVSYGNGKVIENAKEAARFKTDKNKTVNVVSQTTQTPENLQAIVTALSKRYKVKVFNTICKATFDRQHSAAKLAKKMDLMLVIGGKNSGNTTRLAQICRKETRTHHIETAKDIKKSWFKNAGKIGLTAGASTPDWIIEQVKEEVEKQGKR